MLRSYYNRCSLEFTCQLMLENYWYGTYAHPPNMAIYATELNEQPVTNATI